jgi:hypothetical protein
MASKSFNENYRSGLVLINNPIQLGSAFAAAFVVCAIVEKMYATAGEVSNTFFRALFPAVSEEVLVLGTLSLCLTLGTSLIPNLADYQDWAIMCDWAQACLLFMAVTFVVIVSAIAGIFNKTIQRFDKFETQRLGTRGLDVDDREQLFTLAVNKFKFSLRACGFDKPVFLARYLRPIGERNVVSVANLTWKVWLALSGMVVLNALRTKLVDAAVGGDGVLNVASFIIVCGYGPLLLYIQVHRQLVRRCGQYLEIGAAEAATVAASMDPNNGALSAVGLSSAGRNVNDAAAAFVVSRADLDDPTAFLVWQSLPTTILILQVSFFFLVWFGAVFFLSMMYRVFTFNIGLALLFFVAAVAPLVIYCMMCPWTFIIVAILSSLGTCLNEGRVRRVQRERADELNQFLHGSAASGGGAREGRRSPEQAAADAEQRGGGGDGAGGDSSTHRVRVRKVARRPIVFDDEAMSRLVVEAQRNALNERDQLDNA